MADFTKSLFFGKLSNIVIAMVSAILLIFNVAQVKDSAPGVDLSDYNLVFDDEFDGDSLNPYVWRNHNDEGMRKGGFWTLDRVSVKDGNLVIKTEYKDGKFGKGWYTGAIDTSNSFMRKYGYFETRCILPKGKGLWSAFWLMTERVAQVNGNGKDGTEIDVFESPFYYLKGQNSWKVTSNLHYDGYGVNTRYKNVIISALDNNPYENYNTYSVLWNENEYVFYVNGHEVAKTNYGGVSRTEEYMILSCEVDGANGTPTYGWSGRIDRNGGNDFSTEFVVDYVRAYTHK